MQNCIIYGLSSRRTVKVYMIDLFFRSSKLTNINVIEDEQTADLKTLHITKKTKIRVTFFRNIVDKSKYPKQAVNPGVN